MQPISTIGLDIAKSVFQVHGVDAAGQVIIRRQLKRRQVLTFFQKLPPCLVGIDTRLRSAFGRKPDLSAVLREATASGRLPQTCESPAHGPGLSIGIPASSTSDGCVGGSCSVRAIRAGGHFIGVSFQNLNSAQSSLAL